MGCGKSSVGRRLSELLCCPFMDLDDVIVQHTGRTIPEIFATDGEAAFRQMELAALRSIVSNEGMVEREKKQPLPSQAMGPTLCGQRGSTVFSPSLPCSPTVILSLGGGTVMTPECAALIHEQTVCIYLRTSVDTLVARLANEAARRPLLAQQSAMAPQNNGCHSSSAVILKEAVPTSVIPSEVEESTSQSTRLRSRIESLMSSRFSTYESTAHHIIDTDGLSIDAVARLLYEKL